MAPAAHGQHRPRHHHRCHRHHHHHNQQQQHRYHRQRHANATDDSEAAAETESSTEEDNADIGEGHAGGDEINEESEDDEMTMGEKTRRARWLVSGGKDGRVVVWELMDFNGGLGTQR